MTFKEIQRYLNGDCVVRNDEYEYKTEPDGEFLYYKEIGGEEWIYDAYGIDECEKNMEWELVGKK